MRVIQMNPSSLPVKERVRPIVPPSAKAVPKPVVDIKAFKTDDWILLLVIAALILEGSDDYILICALGYLFLMGL